MSLVPIIIPFFREQDKLDKCLAAIKAQSHPHCEAFVRDNTHDNILFTAAVNEGLAKFCYRPDVDFVLVLNQDAYLHQDCIRQLLKFMQEHPECGIACPLQVAEGKKQIKWGGVGTALQLSGGKTVTWGGSLQAFPSGAHRCDDFASYVRPRETFWANGACMMIRTEVVREVGVFDKNMRFICSDSDFSFSARARGWKIFVVPDALVEHALAASGRHANEEINLVKCRDALYFAQKWLSGDVYKRLSFEGSQLTAMGVKNNVARLNHTVRQLEEAASGGKAPSPLVLPSWVTAMSIKAGG